MYLGTGYRFYMEHGRGNWLYMEYGIAPLSTCYRLKIFLTIQYMLTIIYWNILHGLEVIKICYRLQVVFRMLYYFR